MSTRKTWTALQRDGPNHLGLWCARHLAVHRPAGPAGALVVAASADTAHTAHTAVPCVSTAHVTKTLPSISSKTLPLQRLTGVGGGGYRWQAAVAFPVPVTVPPAGAGADPGVVTLLHSRKLSCRTLHAPLTLSLLLTPSTPYHSFPTPSEFFYTPLHSFHFFTYLWPSTLAHTPQMCSV